jgi:HEAT repeat protein
VTARHVLACLFALTASAVASEQNPEYRGRPLSEWIADLTGPDFTRRTNANTAIHNMGERAVPGLLAAIGHADARATVTLLMALDFVCCDKTTALPALRPLLKHPNERVRVAAASSIGLIEGKPAPDTLAILLEGLESSDGLASWKAAFTLRKFGPKAEPAVPALVRALKHPDGDTRLAAAFALGEVGASATSAIPALEEILAGQDEALKQNAAVALKAIRGQ